MSMKKLLLVMEMNQTLVYINNIKAAYANFSPALRDIINHDSHQNFDFFVQARQSRTYQLYLPKLMNQ